MACVLGFGRSVRNLVLTTSVCMMEGDTWTGLGDFFHRLEGADKVETADLCQGMKGGRGW